MLACMFLISWQAAGQTTLTTSEAGALVRQTVSNELAAANAGGHYMYRFHKQTPEGSETRDIIETRKWLIGRLIRKNGQALAPAAQQDEDERLRGLLTHRTRLAKLQEDQLYDQARIRRMLKAMPAAFLYQRVRTETPDSGRKLVRLSFRPNPEFRPTSLQLRVLLGMRGTMLIDPVAKRLVRVDAKLFKDVNFGWGLLGRIYHGATFLLEQHGVGEHRWAITTLKLNYTNRKLLLFTSHADSVRKADDFRRMPDNLTLKQGLELLLNKDEMAASDPGAHTVASTTQKELR